MEEKTLRNVSCEVDNCVYNNQARECTADSIHVGSSEAEYIDETACETFEPQ